MTKNKKRKKQDQNKKNLSGRISKRCMLKLLKTCICHQSTLVRLALTWKQKKIKNSNPSKLNMMGIRALCLNSRSKQKGSQSLKVVQIIHLIRALVIQIANSSLGGVKLGYLSLLTRNNNRPAHPLRKPCQIILKT